MYFALKMMKSALKMMKSALKGGPKPKFWQVCWSNSSLVDYMTAYAKGALEKGPPNEFLEISPNDGGAECQRPLELQINAEEGTPAGSFWRAIQSIAEGIAPEHPNAKIVSLSYAWTQHPPQDLPTSKLTMMHHAIIPCESPPPTKRAHTVSLIGMCLLT